MAVSNSSTRSRTQSKTHKAGGKTHSQPKTSTKAKKVKIGLSLTPASASTLDQMAEIAQLSRSAVIEKLASGQLALSSSKATTGFHLALSADPAAEFQGVEAVKWVIHPLSSTQSSSIPEPPVLPEGQNTPDTQNATLALEVETLQRTVEVQRSTINTLQQQLTILQTQLDRYQAEATTQQHQYATLKHSAEQQAQVIATLQQQTRQLRQAAAIGETQLNKWRHRSYSH